jgi:hypothetical protein
VGAVLGLLPVVFGISLLLPDSPLALGVGTALGCGGSGNVSKPAGWVWLKPSLMSNTDRTFVPVATDGFFVIDAEGNDLPVEAAQDGMSLVVSDEAGMAVAGETKLLIEKQAGWYLFAWRAAAPLQMGQKLTATLAATPLGTTDPTQVGGQFPLVVTGPPAPLPTPLLAFNAWNDFYHGEGALLSCKTDPLRFTCGGPATVEVPEVFVKQASTQALWQLPPVTSGVAWQARLEASPDQPDAVLPGLSVEYLADTSEPVVDMGYLVFPTAAKSYCATLVVKDLRNGDETRAETCAQPEGSEWASTDSKLAYCAEPPSLALTEAWCALQHPPSALDACAAEPGGTPSPTAGSPRVPPQSGTGGTGPGADPVAMATPSRTTSACQFGAAGHTRGHALAFLLALVVAARKRRASRPAFALPRVSRLSGF